ncbi:TldD/PmbA family protein [Caloranaerobacter azorensis]|uniref:TldD/PmbA family protein n=1 Tax=Caloranaerobacter azorensis TaxID=116090 RepID=A0A6P1YBU1_9FIRM|nr:TldD/PmbA family protein [Caloranaerobacter azorensis]QIB26810.1 TldD/PmbA family protein [Caloranaerobacter azorensis]
MDKRVLINRIFEEGRKKGLKDMEVFIQESDNFKLRVFKGQVDELNISKEEGLSFRCIYNGKMGYSYTEKLDETSIDMLINEAVENASAVDSEDVEEIFAGSKSYTEVDSFNTKLENLNVKDGIEFAKSLEKETLELDKRVISVPHCIFNKQSMHTILVNTKGLNLEDKSNIAYSYVNVMVKENDDVKTSSKYIISNDFSKFDYKVLAKHVVEEAVSMLGAESVKSDAYPVILRNDVAADILGAFSPIFSAENVQKNLSLLKGKLNKKIASEIITIVDNPFMKGGIASCSFDNEGVATKYKKVVDRGILTTYLHNMKTAKKDGVQSTGNGFKSSFKSPVSISPTNMYIENGDKSLDEMIRSVKRGILIIDVKGLHSGLNTVSGDFSLAASGYEIIDGRINRSVNQITIAGNFYDLLNNVLEIGNDLKFALPMNGFIGSPSLKIKELSVAGM